MSISSEDVIRFDLPEAEFKEALTFGYHVLTHAPREHDPLSQLIQVLLDELAERMVIAWLHANGKAAEPVSDKGATQPDTRHEIWVTDIRGARVRAAIHTFLSTNKSEITEILQHHALSVEPNTVCGINFSVSYWLRLHDKPRVKFPSLNHAAIIGWASDKNFREAVQSQSGRPPKYVEIKYCDLRPASELLQFLV